MKKRARVLRFSDIGKRIKRLMAREIAGLNRDSRLNILAKRITVLNQALHDMNLKNGMPGPRRIFITPSPEETRKKLKDLK